MTYDEETGTYKPDVSRKPISKTDTTQDVQNGTSYHWPYDNGYCQCDRCPRCGKPYRYQQTYPSPLGPYPWATF